MRVQEIIRAKSSRLITISPTSSLREAVRLIASKQIGMLPVVEGEVPVGLLSEREILGFISERGSDALSLPVSSAMTDIRLFAAPQDSIAYIMRVMTEQRARHLPVLSDDSLVGVISIGDILKFRLTEKDMEAAVLRDIARISLASAA